MLSFVCGGSVLIAAHFLTLVLKFVCMSLPNVKDFGFSTWLTSVNC